MMVDASETANYRYYRRLMWQVVHARYVEAAAEATHSGMPEAEAQQHAARSVRGDLRALMSELLTHAPVAAVVVFLEAAQQWGEFGERLLEEGPAVVALVDSAEPQPSWHGPGVLDRETAEDDARWQAWVQGWLDAFRAAAPEVAAAVGDSQPRPERSVQPRRWVPWALGAAAVVGTTVAVVLASRETSETEGRDGRKR